METVANPPFLQRRPSAFYYRRAIPGSLQSAIGKREFVVSLKTADLREAKRRYAEQHALVERILEAAERGIAEPAVASREAEPVNGVEAFVRMAARSYFNELESADEAALRLEWPTDLEERKEAIEIEASRYVAPDPDLQHMQPVATRIVASTGFRIDAGTPDYRRLCVALNGAHLEHLKRHYRRLFPSAPPFNYRPTGLDHVGADVAAPPSSGCTVATMIERFDADARRANIRAKTKKSASAPAKRLLLEVLGAQTPLAAVRREQLTDLRSILLGLPPRAASAYPGQSLRVISRRNVEQDGPRLSPKTVDNQLVWVTAMFTFAEREQMIASNPARHLGLGRSTSHAPSRRPWSMTALNRLFRAPAFTVADGDPSHFWVPLLALFQGLRMNEACQLYTDDFCEIDGVPALRIASNPDRQQATKKNDTRIVPIHPTLLSIGILKLLQNLTADEPQFVFASLSRDADGSATNAFSKWFLRMIRSQGIDEPGVVFHSFRHNFADALRRANVSEERGDALGGWHSRGSARRGYGEGYKPADLLPDLSKVDYPGLDLSSLKPRF